MGSLVVVPSVELGAVVFATKFGAFVCNFANFFVVLGTLIGVLTSGSTTFGNSESSNALPSRGLSAGGEVSVPLLASQFA